MRVLVCDPFYSLEAVQELLSGIAVDFGEMPWQGDDVVALLTGPDYPVAAEDLDRLPALRVIATCSVGYEHLPLDAARARGIWVANVPDYCVEEMADSALALLLALLRGVVVLDRNVHAGGWDWTAAGPLKKLRGTRLGVIGFGRIGRALAARAVALGMEVWATDPVVPPQTIAAAGVRAATFDELIGSCTAFSLHVPLGPATRGLIRERELARMPHGSVLVNTSRAALVDQDALLVALASGHLAAAALDVLPAEPPTREQPLPLAPTLVVTPHAAWYSLEAEEEAQRRAVLTVRTALDGQRPPESLT